MYKPQTLRELIVAEHPGGRADRLGRADLSAEHGQEFGDVTGTVVCVRANSARTEVDKPHLTASVDDDVGKANRPECDARVMEAVELAPKIDKHRIADFAVRTIRKPITVDPTP